MEIHVINRRFPFFYKEGNTFDLYTYPDLSIYSKLFIWFARISYIQFTVHALLYLHTYMLIGYSISILTLKLLGARDLLSPYLFGYNFLTENYENVVTFLEKNMKTCLSPIWKLYVNFISVQILPENTWLHFPKIYPTI